MVGLDSAGKVSRWSGLLFGLCERLSSQTDPVPYAHGRSRDTERSKRGIDYRACASGKVPAVALHSYHLVER